MKPADADLLRQIILIREVAVKRGIVLPDIETEARSASLQQVRAQYRDDPVGFCETVLGETLTDDIKLMLESVRDNRITIAKSANSTGKTFASARAAAWFFTMWEESQVHTTAAPPEKNLRRLLWGEIDAVVEKHPWIFADAKLQVTHIQRKRKELRSWITGHSIPQSGTEEQREAKFCTGADELFELTTGELVTYRSLIGKTVRVMSVSPGFEREETDAEFFDNGIEGVYEVVLSSGHKVVRTGRHPLFAGKIGQCFKTLGGTHVKGRYRVGGGKWTSVEDLQVGDAVLVPQDTEFNFGSLSMDPNEIKVLAYLIGDGCVSSGRKIQFFQEDNRQLAEFKAAVSALGAWTTEYNPKLYSITVRGDGSGNDSNPILNLVRTHGLLGKDSSTKRVPEAINQLSRDDVAIFLSRLFSTDGWACMTNCSPGYRKAQIGYSSKNEGLVRDIQRLLLRFGVASKVRRKKASWTYKGVLKSNYQWALEIVRKVDIIRFAETIGIFGKEEGVEECAAFARGRAAGATWREGNIAGFRWDKVKSVTPLGERPTVGVHVPVNNTYLTALVEHNSGKHSAHMLWIVDEGDAVPDEVYRGIESCMSGTHDRMLIMLNPRAEIGAAHTMIKDGKASVIKMSAFDHPNVRTGQNEIPGAVSRESVVRRINEWSRPLHEDEKSTDECFEVPKFLVGAIAERPEGGDYAPLAAGWREVTEPSLWYMVLAEYPAQSEFQLISRAWVNAARARWDMFVALHGKIPPTQTKAVMGVDIAEFGADDNVVCLRYGGYVAPMRTWRGVDVEASADEAIAIYLSEEVDRACVDAIGIGAAMAPKMRRSGCRGAQAVKVSEKPTKRLERDAFSILRDQLGWEVARWLEKDSGAMLPPDEDLVEELLVQQYRRQNGRMRISKKDTVREKLPRKRSPNRWDALCLTFAPARKVLIDFV